MASSSGSSGNVGLFSSPARSVSSVSSGDDDHDQPASGEDGRSRPASQRGPGVLFRRPAGEPRRLFSSAEDDSPTASPHQQPRAPGPAAAPSSAPNTLRAYGGAAAIAAAATANVAPAVADPELADLLRELPAGTTTATMRIRISSLRERLQSSEGTVAAYAAHLHHQQEEMESLREANTQQYLQLKDQQQHIEFLTNLRLMTPEERARQMHQSHQPGFNDADGSGLASGGEVNLSLTGQYDLQSLRGRALEQAHLAQQALEGRLASQAAEIRRLELEVGLKAREKESITSSTRDELQRLRVEMERLKVAHTGEKRAGEMSTESVNELRQHVAELQRQVQVSTQSLTEAQEAQRTAEAHMHEAFQALHVSEQQRAQVHDELEGQLVEFHDLQELHTQLRLQLDAYEAGDGGGANLLPTLSSSGVGGGASSQANLQAHYEGEMDRLREVYEEEVTRLKTRLGLYEERMRQLARQFPGLKIDAFMDDPTGEKTAHLKHGNGGENGPLGTLSPQQARAVYSSSASAMRASPSDEIGRLMSASSSDGSAAQPHQQQPQPPSSSSSSHPPDHLTASQRREWLMSTAEEYTDREYVVGLKEQIGQLQAANKTYLDQIGRLEAKVDQREDELQEMHERLAEVTGGGSDDDASQDADDGASVDSADDPETRDLLARTTAPHPPSHDLTRLTRSNFASSLPPARRRSAFHKKYALSEQDGLCSNRQHEHLMQQCVDLQAELSRTRKEVRESEALHTEHQRLTEQVAMLQRELGASQANLASALAGKATVASEDVGAQQQQIQLLQSQLVLAKTQEERLQHQLTLARDDAAQATARNGQVEERMRELEEDFEALEAEERTMRQHLEGRLLTAEDVPGKRRRHRDGTLNMSHPANKKASGGGAGGAAGEYVDRATEQYRAQLSTISHSGQLLASISEENSRLTTEAIAKSAQVRDLQATLDEARGTLKEKERYWKEEYARLLEQLDHGARERRETEAELREQHAGQLRGLEAKASLLGAANDELQALVTQRDRRITGMESQVAQTQLRFDELAQRLVDLRDGFERKERAWKLRQEILEFLFQKKSNLERLRLEARIGELEKEIQRLNQLALDASKQHQKELAWTKQLITHPVASSLGVYLKTFPTAAQDRMVAPDLLAIKVLDLLREKMLLKIDFAGGLKARSEIDDMHALGLGFSDLDASKTHVDVAGMAEREWSTLELLLLQSWEMLLFQQFQSSDFAQEKLWLFLQKQVRKHVGGIPGGKSKSAASASSAATSASTGFSLTGGAGRRQALRSNGLESHDTDDGVGGGGDSDPDDLTVPGFDWASSPTGTFNPLAKLKRGGITTEEQDRLAEEREARQKRTFEEADDEIEALRAALHESEARFAQLHAHTDELERAHATLEKQVDEWALREAESQASASEKDTKRLGVRFASTGSGSTVTSPKSGLSVTTPKGGGGGGGHTRTLSGGVVLLQDQLTRSGDRLTRAQKALTHADLALKAERARSEELVDELERTRQELHDVAAAMEIFRAAEEEEADARRVAAVTAAAVAATTTRTQGGGMTVSLDHMPSSGGLSSASSSPAVVPLGSPSRAVTLMEAQLTQHRERANHAIQTLATSESAQKALRNKCDALDRTLAEREAEVNELTREVQRLRSQVDNYTAREMDQDTPIVVLPSQRSASAVHVQDEAEEQEDEKEERQQDPATARQLAALSAEKVALSTQVRALLLQLEEERKRSAAVAAAASRLAPAAVTAVVPRTPSVAPSAPSVVESAGLRSELKRALVRTSALEEEVKELEAELAKVREAHGGTKATSASSSSSGVAPSSASEEQIRDLTHSQRALARELADTKGALDLAQERAEQLEEEVAESKAALESAIRMQKILQETKIPSSASSATAAPTAASSGGAVGLSPPAASARKLDALHSTEREALQADLATAQEEARRAKARLAELQAKYDELAQRHSQCSTAAPPTSSSSSSSSPSSSTPVGAAAAPTSTGLSSGQREELAAIAAENLQKSALVRKLQSQVSALQDHLSEKEQRWRDERSQMEATVHGMEQETARLAAARSSSSSSPSSPSPSSTSVPAAAPVDPLSSSMNSLRLTLETRSRRISALESELARTTLRADETAEELERVREECERLREEVRQLRAHARQQQRGAQEGARSASSSPWPSHLRGRARPGASSRSRSRSPPRTGRSSAHSHSPPRARSSAAVRAASSPPYRGASSSSGAPRVVPFPTIDDLDASMMRALAEEEGRVGLQGERTAPLRRHVPVADLSASSGEYHPSESQGAGTRGWLPNFGATAPHNHTNATTTTTTTMATVHHHHHVLAAPPARFDQKVHAATGQPLPAPAGANIGVTPARQRERSLMQTLYTGLVQGDGQVSKETLHSLQLAVRAHQPGDDHHRHPRSSRAASASPPPPPGSTKIAAAFDDLYKAFAPGVLARGHSSQQQQQQQQQQQAAPQLKGAAAIAAKQFQPLKFSFDDEKQPFAFSPPSRAFKALPGSVYAVGTGSSVASVTGAEGEFVPFPFFPRGPLHAPSMHTRSDPKRFSARYKDEIALGLRGAHDQAEAEAARKRKEEKKRQRELDARRLTVDAEPNGSAAGPGAAPTAGGVHGPSATPKTKPKPYSYMPKSIVRPLTGSAQKAKTPNSAQKR